MWFNKLPLEYYAYSSLINCVVSLAISILVLLKRSESRSARLYAYLSALIGFWALFYFLWLRVTNDRILAEYFVRTCMVFVTLIPTIFLHFVAELTGELKHRALYVGNYLLSLIICTTVYTPRFSPGVAPHLVFPFWPLPGPTFLIHFFQATLSVVAGIWMLGRAAARSEGRMRTQFLWTFWAFSIGWFSALMNYLQWFRFPFPPLFNPFVFVFVASIAYAIIKHQLMDIRIVIRRSLVYSLLIAGITGSYLVMVLIMEHWFAGFVGYRSIFATLIVAFLIAIGFNPLRERLQTFVDLALFKATPAELATQREQLLVEVRKGEQQKAVATLAAGLAHEIKNPLASIKTFTEYLTTHYADPTFREKFQKIVGGEVERINLIVQQLLEFAKPVPPKLLPMDVSQLMDDTVTLLNNELLTHQADVQREYDSHQPILGDPQQLKQVFLNLFLNSLHAMNGHGQLCLKTKQRGAELEITVQDNGQGIPAEHLARIFEPFFSTKPNGTGLGLAVVQGIIKEHGGSIRVESQVSHGTTIRLYLPAAAS